MVRTLTGTSQRTEPAGQLQLLRGSYGSFGAWKRKMGSATQAGLALPSSSMTALAVTCRPPVTSVTSARVAVSRILPPTGTGAGKRTLFRP